MGKIEELEKKFIGKELNVLDSDKKIIVNKIKLLSDGQLLFTDEDGNIYTDDELDIKYCITPEYLLFKTLCDNDILPHTASFKFEQYNNALNAFMDGMIKIGYIATNESS